MTIVLASASPRRKELLQAIGLAFEVRPVDADESFVTGEAPWDAALRLARAKALLCAERIPNSVVLAADTIVAVPDKTGADANWDILGKPADKADAGRMLRALSGRSHLVVTAFSLFCPARGIDEAEAVRTEVIFRPLDQLEVEAYAASRECMDKAGAYAIQGTAAAFITAITGSHSNVIGLPLAEVCGALQKHGLWHPGMLPK